MYIKKKVIIIQEINKSCLINSSIKFALYQCHEISQFYLLTDLFWKKLNIKKKEIFFMSQTFFHCVSK